MSAFSYRAKVPNINNCKVSHKSISLHALTQPEAIRKDDKAIQNVLHFAAWWPREDRPFEGIFIREQVLSTCSFSAPTVVHLRIHKSRRFFPFKVMTTSLNDEGIEVILVDVFTSIRRFGAHNWLIKHAYSTALKQLERTKKFSFYHIHVRNHITKLIPELPRLKAYPFVLTEHFSFYHRGFFQLSVAEQTRQQAEISQWFGNQNLISIMPVSQELCDTLEDRFAAPPAKLKVVGNVANPVFHHDPEVAIQDATIVLTANWSAPKNPMLFLNAFKQIESSLTTPFTISIIGGGPQIEEMKTYAGKELSHHSIRFHGPQPKKFIAKMMQQACFFVHPTDAENAPTVISEAHCCGTPVLSMAVNGIPEMVHATNGLLVEAQSAEALGKGLVQMIENHRKFDRRKIALEAANRYSQRAIASAIKAQYDKLTDLG